MVLGRHQHMHQIAIADRGVLQVYKQNSLLELNLSTITLSNVNLTVCMHRSKRVTQRLNKATAMHGGTAELRTYT